MNNSFVLDRDLLKKIIGFSAFWAWTPLMLMAPPVGLSPIEPSALSVQHFYITLVQLVVVMAAVLVSRRFFPLRSKRTAQIACPVALAMGALVVIVTGFLGRSLLLSLASALLSGVGLSGFRLIWGEAFSELPDARSRRLVMFFGMALAYNICVVAGAVPVLALGLPVVLPFLAMVLLRAPAAAKPSGGGAAAGEEDGVSEEDARTERPKFPLFVLLYGFVCALPFGAYQALLSQAAAPLDWNLIFAVLLIFFVAAALVDYMASRRVGDNIPGYVLAILGGGLMLSVFVGSVREDVVNIPIMLGQQLSLVFIFDVLASYARTSTLPPAQVFARGFVAIDAGVAVGLGCALWFGAFAPATLPAFTAFIMYAVFLTGILLLPRFAQRRQLEKEAEAAQRALDSREAEESADAGAVPEVEAVRDRALVDCAVERFDLTAREAEVLELLLRGYRQQAIADKLILSRNTVKSHVAHIYQKSSTHNVDELIDLLRDEKG
ncbi:LuxR C-terminal-related transcriptional regulator [Adlercreutzia equolifaciens]|uniref:helix-turn-helix transcriptional regulator n=1 Tax=Adlercreutzia equolifaciens TaxID=446660 RepID=UPI0023AFC1C2|nr:LuxR family transcriptional regulator [Adlercreutzia equolifaciens]MDE8702439.1 LuxR C-terminal-related transcriptional regulator [Adlercreutzia equolifaciens]